MGNKFLSNYSNVSINNKLDRILEIGQDFEVMMHEHSFGQICPNCRQIDMVQTASAIVATGTQHNTSNRYLSGRIGGYPSANFYGHSITYGQGQTELAELLSPPSRPRYRSFWNWKLIGSFVFLFIMGNLGEPASADHTSAAEGSRLLIGLFDTTIILLIVLTILTKVLFHIVSPRKSIFTIVLIVVFLLLLLVGIVTLISLTSYGAFSVPYSLILGAPLCMVVVGLIKDTQRQVQCVERFPYWQYAMSTWHDLNYCGRCHMVFLQNQLSCYPASQVNALLYSPRS